MTDQAIPQPVQVPAHRPRNVAEMLLHDQGLRQSIGNALPKHITPDRMARVCLTALRRNPKLLQVKPESLLAAIMVCSQLGLEPNDPRALAYLIPYKDECQLIIGYRGYIELAMRSGMVNNIQAMPVYERDLFEYEQGMDLKLRHVPYIGDEKPGRVIAAYAVATMANGAKAFVVCPRRDIERAKAASSGVKSGRSTPWDDWFPEMAMKTAVRRLAKFMPQSPEFARALEADEAQSLRIDPVTMAPESIDIEPATIEAIDDGEPTEAQAQAQDLGARLAQKAATVATPAKGQSRFAEEGGAA